MKYKKLKMMFEHLSSVNQFEIEVFLFSFSKEKRVFKPPQLYYGGKIIPQTLNED